MAVTKNKNWYPSSITAKQAKEAGRKMRGGGGSTANSTGAGRQLKGTTTTRSRLKQTENLSNRNLNAGKGKGLYTVSGQEWTPIPSKSTSKSTRRKK